MSNRTAIHFLFCFVCGILIGYVTRAFYDDYNQRKSNKRRKTSLSTENITKDVFEYEIRNLFKKLDSIENKLNLKLIIKTTNQQNYLDQSNDDDELDNLNDEFNNNEELFFDTSEDWRVYIEQKSDKIADKNNIDFAEIDRWFDDDDMDKKFIYDHLTAHLKDHENDPNFLWRYAKAGYSYGKILASNKNKEQRKKIFYESYDYAKRAMELDDTNGDCHKWYAICIGVLTEFVGFKDKISYGVQFKYHLDKAMEMKQDDPVLYYLSGRFCLELLEISWAEKKIAAILFEALPDVSLEDAYNNFKKAYELKPNWKENIRYFVEALIKMKKYDEAMEYIEKGIAIPIKGDENFHKDLLEMQKKCTNR